MVVMTVDTMAVVATTMVVAMEDTTMVVEDTTTAVEDTTMVVDDTTMVVEDIMAVVVVEEDIAGMAAVVVDVTTTEGAGVAALLQRQLHTNKLMRPKLTTDLGINCD